MDLMATALAWLRENLFITKNTPETVAMRHRLSLGLLLKRVSFEASQESQKKLRAATGLASEVAVLIERGKIAADSPVAKALGGYVDPPTTFYVGRLAAVEEELEAKTMMLDAANEIGQRIAASFEEERRINKLCVDEIEQLAAERALLLRVVEAEERFVKESGLTVVDTVAEALAAVRAVIPKLVVCRPCSEAGGAERNIEHEAPACDEPEGP